MWADLELPLSMKLKLLIRTKMLKSKDLLAFKFSDIVYIILIIVKGIYLSKALACMKIFLYKQELYFCQGDGYLW